MMDYAKFLEIVTGYRANGFDVIVKKCPDCKGNGQYIAANQRKHRLVDVDCPHCHATGRIVYPISIGLRTDIAKFKGTTGRCLQPAIGGQ